MSTVSLRSLTPEGEVALTALPLAEVGSSCEVRLRCLPGASGLHLVLVEGEGVSLRAELRLPAGEEATLVVERTADAGVRMTCDGRRLITLPPDERYAPPLPICAPEGPPMSLDLAWVIDGTVCCFDAGQGGGNKAEEAASPPKPFLRPLLAGGDAWERHVEDLVTLTEALAEGYEDLRVTVLAFGDRQPPGVEAPDLRPIYQLVPEEEAERVLRPFGPAVLRERLLALEATSGGDFVDALAEALLAARELGWREGGRRLVIVDGDSPGFSLLHPAPRGADAAVRRVDVDTQALALHRRGIEVATLYHDAAWASGYYTMAEQRALLEHARRQYRRLASHPGVAFGLSGFDPGETARALASPPKALGRGPSFAELVEVREIEPRPAPAVASGGRS